MLPRLHRLHRTRDIKAVVQKGTCLTTSAVRICYLPTATASRVACIVSKKVSARATDRHTYQRWLRHAARRVLQETASNQQYDMVWTALPDIRRLTSSTAVYNDVRAQLPAIFIKPQQIK